MSCAWLGPVEVLMISKDIAFASGRLNDLLKEEGITYPEGYRDDREKAREESTYVDMWAKEIEEARNERDRLAGWLAGGMAGCRRDRGRVSPSRRCQ